MEKHSRTEKAVHFLKSPFYLITLSLLALAGFLFPYPYNFIPSVLFGLLSFLPILQNDGIYYIASFILVIPSANRPFRARDVPLPLVLSIGLVFFSLILFLIVRKVKRRTGFIFYLLLSFLLLILASYIINAIERNRNYRQCWFFIVFFLAEIFIYRRRCSATSGRKGFDYLSEVSSVLAILLFLEVGFTLRTKEKHNAFSPFDLSYDSGDAIASLIILTLPFLGYGIYKKRWYYCAFVLLDYFTLLVLGNTISLLFLLIGFIPLVFLAFHSYKGYYPYFLLVGLVVLLAPFCFLLFFSQRFSESFLKSRQAFRLLEKNNPNYSQIQSGIFAFESNYLIGASLLSVTTESGFSMIPNGYIQIGVISGSLGLTSYLFADLIRYLSARKGKTKADRYFFLFFLILHDLLNYLRDATTDWTIFLLRRIVISTFQGSCEEGERIIHDDFKDIRDDNNVQFPAIPN